MITAWGDQQTGNWEAVTTEDDFSSDVVYQFNYTLPEKPWWAYWIFWFIWPKDPKVLRDAVVKAIAAKTKIKEDEIEVLWFTYNSDTNKFQIQIKWVPSTPEEQGEAIPAAATLLTIAYIITIISIPLSIFLLGKYISDLAPDTIEKLVEETRKGISWVTILTGIVVVGSLVPLFFVKRKGG